MATAQQLRDLAELEEAERVNDNVIILTSRGGFWAPDCISTRAAQRPAPFSIFYELRDGLIYIRPKAAS